MKLETLLGWELAVICIIALLGGDSLPSVNERGREGWILHTPRIAVVGSAALPKMTPNLGVAIQVQYEVEYEGGRDVRWQVPSMEDQPRFGYGGAGVLFDGSFSTTSHPPSPTSAKA